MSFPVPVVALLARFDDAVAALRCARLGLASGVATVAVTYGFTDPAVLRELEPDYLIDDIRELKDILTVRSRR